MYTYDVEYSRSYYAIFQRPENNFSKYHKTFVK